MKRNMLCALSAFCLMILSVFNAGSQTTDPALVLQFNFDGGATDVVPDASGHNNVGWQYNTTNRIGATNGVFGTSAGQFTYAGYLSNDFPHIYRFSQYLAVTNLNGFSYLTNGTISLWARFDDNNDNGMFILDTGYDFRYASNPSLASNSWTLGRLFTANLSFCTFPNSGGTQVIAQWPDDVVRSGGFTPDFSTTNFHLYTVTFDCSNDQAVAYYDGSPFMTNNVGVPWLRIYGCSSIPWLCIGASCHDGTPFWNDDNYPNAAWFVGRLDDLRIYNRTLAANEVQGLYFGAGTKALASAGVIQSGGQNPQLSWVGQSNTMYQVQSKSSLTDPSWTAVGSPILSDGGTSTMPIGGQSSQFFRIRPLPY
jgi:hypothetical protein